MYIIVNSVPAFFCLFLFLFFLLGGGGGGQQMFGSFGVAVSAVQYSFTGSTSTINECVYDFLHFGDPFW